MGGPTDVRVTVGARDGEVTSGPPIEQHIQGLRGLAVLAVVLFHLRFLRVFGGFLGVDVFFVISGYVITLSLLREHRGFGRIGLAAFFTRRIRRLLPTAIVVVLATSVWLVWVTRHRTLLPRDQAVAAAGGWSNIWFAIQRVGYDVPYRGSPPFGQMWSLALEEQFYLVWAPLLALVLWLARGRRTSTVVGLVALVGGAGSMAVNLAWGSGVDPQWAFYLLPARAWELLAGVAVAVLPRLLRGWVATVAGWSGLGLVVVALFAFEPLAGAHSWGPTVVVGGSMLVLAVGEEGRWGSGRALRLWPLRALGAIAYPLYLSHWLVVLWFLDRRDGDLLASRAQNVALLLASLAIAVALHFGVERPLRWSRWLSARPARTLLAGLGAGVLSMVLVAVALDPGVIGVGPYRPGSEDVYLPTDVVPTFRDLLRFEDPPIPDCRMDEGECVWGDPASEIDVALFGDSHARQWLTTLDRLGVEQGWRVHFAWGAACRWAEVSGYVGTEDGGCPESRRVNTMLAQRVQPELVILAGYYAGNLAGVDGPDFLSGAKGSIERLGAERLIVLGDNPTPPRDWIDCVLDHEDDPRFCEFDRSSGLDEVSADLVRTVAEQVGATYVDTFDWFCPGATCPVIDGRHLIYRDENHLADSMAPLRAGQLRAAVEAALAQRARGG